MMTPDQAAQSSHGFSPLWRRTRGPLEQLPEFLPGETYDCLVVGAGITGCTAGLHLAETGSRVCIIDSIGPGAGTSGDANGQVMAELTLSPDRIVQLYGQQRGEAVIATSAGAPDLVFDVIARHGIACDAVRNGWIEGTPFAGGMRSIEKRVGSWRRRGAPVELLDRATIRRLSGTTAYAGGILDHRAGTVDPLAYNHGLATAALRHGANIHGEVEARQLVREGGQWRVVTNRGTIHANTLIAATNAYSGGLVPGLRLPVICMHGVQSATAPVSEFRHILPQRHGFSDVRKRFFRLDPEDRLIIGGAGMPWRPHDGHSLPFRLIERALHRLFPETRQLPFEHRWYARGAAAADFLPHLYEPAPGLFAALGFAGRGIAMGTALGFLLARRAKGEATASIGFPMTPACLPLGIGALR